MKYYLLFLGILLIFSSCSDNKDTADAYGNFEAHEIILSAETPGQITRFDFREGQNAQAGDTLCTIDTELLEIKLEQLRVQKQAVKNKFADILAQVKVLEEKKQGLFTEKKRIEKLLRDSAATQKQMDNINSQLDVLNRQIDQVKIKNQAVFDETAILDKQTDYLKAQIEKATVVMPIDGRLLEKYAEVYETAVPGKALCKIADTREMILRAYVSGEQLADIQIGQTGKVYIDKNADEQYEYEGRVVWIADEAEFTPKIIQTKKERVNLVYAVKIAVKNDGRIKIGMPGEFKINTRHEQ